MPKHKYFYVIVSIFIVATIIGCSRLSVPTIEQIKGDLLGEQISVGFSSWKFAALSEYTSFTINGTQQQGNILEYDVSMRLHDFTTGANYLLDALITYKRSGSRWQFYSILPKLYRQL